MLVSEKGKFEISQKSSMDASLENIYYKHEIKYQE